ncbi:zona pellucida sperm-binding protein 3-like [Cetorhinus maximus]
MEIEDIFHIDRLNFGKNRCQQLQQEMSNVPVLQHCLLDSKAEDSFSTFVLPRDEQELDKLRFDLDAFRFLGDDRSLTVMVQCGEDKLLLRVQLDLFGTRHLIKAADLTLGIAGCWPTSIYSQNHTVLFDYRLHECGSRLQMIGDFLIYTTHLNHTPEYHGSVIVRTNGAVVPIECRYFRKGNVSSDPIKPTWIPFSSTKSGEGHLSFSLRLMNGDWLTERTSTIYYLGELIHIEASVSMINHMSLKLYIDRCVATLSPDKDSTPRYSFIDHNGCLLDSKAEDSFSTFVLPRDEQELDKLRFDLDAFRFLGDDRSLIFITCHLKVAPLDQRDSRNKACTFQKLLASILPEIQPVDMKDVFNFHFDEIHLQI